MINFVLVNRLTLPFAVRDEFSLLFAFVWETTTSLRILFMENEISDRT